jgi:hypothetical protein
VSHGVNEFGSERTIDDVYPDVDVGEREVGQGAVGCVVDDPAKGVIHIAHGGYSNNGEKGQRWTALSRRPCHGETTLHRRIRVREIPTKWVQLAHFGGGTTKYGYIECHIPCLLFCVLADRHFQLLRRDKETTVDVVNVAVLSEPAPKLCTLSH